MGDRLRDGGFRQIHWLADLDAEVLIQTVPDAVRSAEGVRQSEREDGRYGRPSSTRDGQRRGVANLNATARRDAGGRISVSRGAMSRNERGRFQHVPGLDGILHPPGAKADQSQIVFWVETLDAVQMRAVPRMGIRLAEGRAERQRGAGPAI
jgi:hypothetical protein